MATSFTRRQFNTIPTENWPVGSPETGTYLVKGTVSTLLINNTRTNLANDNLYGSGFGWFPSPDLNNYGIIVQGNDAVVTNTAADGRDPVYVSIWGWIAEEDQNGNDVAFRNLAGYILGTTYGTVAAAKSALQTAGMYYQYPVGYDGQSPQTGTGSDV
jgi:hypothetical protein